VKKSIKTEAASLAKSEERFRSTLENLLEGCQIIDFEYRYIFINKAAAEQGKKTAEELHGHTMMEMYPGIETTPMFSVLQQCMKDRVPRQMENEFNFDDGINGWFHLNFEPVPEGVFIMSTNITDRKQAAIELIIANKELAFENKEKDKRAAELIIANKKLAFENKEKDKRAAELAIANEEKDKRAAELIIAKEHAEESDRLKSAFLTNMSHEIRTPMNGILGFTELLKEPNLSSNDQQAFIQTIQISGARMLNTINSIVDISKIESGLMKVDIKETNINEQIEFTYKFFKPEAEFKELKFLFKNSLTTKESIIKTDNEKVYGILTNLVKNAIKFTYEGSIEFGYEKKGEFLEFFVKDTGIGIPQKQYQLIFERFRQGSESHNRGYEGSGLGLAIAKTYVEMLGGEIWVESEEGNGSTFYFTIPYNAVLEEKTEIKNAISAEHKEVQLKKLKILIVEDDEISYSLLTKMLQKISKEVLHAITGVQAIESCNNNPDLDLVLMDVKMHDRDGHEATRQIRQFNKDVIIIAQTAYAFSGDREKAIEAGCNDYISKPINKTLLFELIKKLVNKDKK
jgi:PAS domain S-box-containing protein